MLNILGITLPIFIIVAIGFVAVRSGYFVKTDIGILSKFVINIALPALLFKSLSQRSFADIFNGRYLFVYAAASLLLFALGFALAYWREGRRLEAGALRGMGMSFSNSAFIGYPVLLQFVGPVGGVAVALCMLVETLIMLPLTLLLAEAGMHKGSEFSGNSVGKLLTSLLKERLLKNPLILSIVAAITFSSAGLTMPALLSRTIDLLAAASSPVALFVIGGMLVGMQVQGMMLPVTQVFVGKLLLHPLLVFSLFMLLPPIDITLHNAAIVIASMPMLSIYPVLGQKYKQGDVCSATMLTTTALSFVTVSLVMWLLSL